MNSMHNYILCNKNTRSVSLYMYMNALMKAVLIKVLEHILNHAYVSKNFSCIIIFSILYSVK